MTKKKPIQFQIIKNDPTDGHHSFGAGVINLENVTPVFIDVEEKRAFIDMGAMHARSEVERRVKFLNNKDEVPPGGKFYWLCWVTIERDEEGPYYHGVTACELIVNKEAKRGYKSMPEHVNNLDKSLKGRFILEHMDEESKKVLGEFLQEQRNGELWERSSEELKRQLGFA